MLFFGIVSVGGIFIVLSRYAWHNKI